MAHIQWKQPAVPRHVVQMLVVDRKSRFLLIHRSEKCKSARNVWSVPTGTHEIGEHALDCVARELKEEFSLDAKVIYFAHQYENIAGDSSSSEQYHWVLTLFVVIVDDLDYLENKEPDLHDQISIIPTTYIATPEFLEEYTFHPSLTELFAATGSYLREAMESGIQEYNNNILKI